MAYPLSFLSGLTDMDANALSLSQSVRAGTLAPALAVHAILIAAAANSLLKAGLAITLGGPGFRTPVAIILGATAAIAAAYIYRLRPSHPSRSPVAPRILPRRFRTSSHIVRREFSSPHHAPIALLHAMASTLPPPPLPRALIARDSAIHGRGVYANRAIPAGTTLIEYTGERITHAEARRRERLRKTAARLDPASDAACDYLFIADDHTVIDGRHETSPARLINHACETNCDIEIANGRIFLVALTAIARGAELTFDYGYTWREGLAHPCRCGRPACVGFIISAGQRWRLRSGRAVTPRPRPVPSPPPSRPVATTAKVSLNK